MPELMDKVIDNLWIGSLAAAFDTDSLNQNGIKSILTAMRGRFAIQKPFARHQISLDDTNEADALVHFPACIDWIGMEIQKGRGVLVHCQAGMSRSATIVAAYLMHTRNLDVEAALDLIRKARPIIQPNDGFMAQLAVFHSAHYKRTWRSKETRAFYVERAVREVLNGDGSSPEMDMFAKYPRTPSDSTPNTPFPQPRRRLRCKMCRQELATREHMVDHGQVGAATPVTGYTLSPAVSRRPSANDVMRTSRQSVVVSERLPSPSAELARKPSFGTTLTAMTPIVTPESVPTDTSTSDTGHHPPASDVNPTGRKSPCSNAFGGLSMSPMMSPAVGPSETRALGRGSAGLDTRARNKSSLGLVDADVDQQARVVNGHSISTIESEGEDAEGRRHGHVHGAAIEDTTLVGLPTETSSGLPTPPLASPQELAAQIHPTLAALRSSPLISALSASRSPDMTSFKPSGMPGGKQLTMTMNAASPPLLMPDAKCSGYFVEPMKWMEPFLQSGNMTGKIACPNKKCGAKLGSYDWAGIQCSCQEWVVPGFCIHKSKVDEVAI